MVLNADDNVQRFVRLGAAGALGAVTLLWLGWLNPVLFSIGTIALILSLVPLAAGLRLRGGALLGLLFAVLWIAARLGVIETVDQRLIFNQPNTTALAAMITIGALSGGLLGPSRLTRAHRSGVQGQALDAPGSAPVEEAACSSAGESDRSVCRVLEAHREWVRAWAGREEPWPAFDSHLREVLRMLLGATRVRCFRVDAAGKLVALNGSQNAAPDDWNEHALLRHVVTSGRPYYAMSGALAPMVRQLAAESRPSLVWALPLTYEDSRIGLVTAETFDDSIVTEDRLAMAAQVIETLWRHVHEAEALRVARLTDCVTGVLNRQEFLSILPETVEQCYRANEPVVMFVLCIEGIRGLDDAGDWQMRDAVIEAVGQAVHQRLRKEDIVGRFGDDRFVVLLRRLDVALAELITRKLMQAVEHAVSGLAGGAPLQLRGGLAGSGLAKVSARELLVAALAAAQAARKAGLAIVVHEAQVELEEVSV